MLLCNFETDFNGKPENYMTKFTHDTHLYSSTENCALCTFLVYLRTSSCHIIWL